MVKKKNATSAGKRFTFSSFRDRIESLKIDPLLKTSRNAFDEVETSHFLSTYEHYREINLSKPFTELGESIEPLCRSLTQLIYHQSEIFAFLEASLLLNNPLSLHPTLELLSQFAHDLGSDFMTFYPRALKVIVELAPKQTEAEPINWIFDTLTYLFKYSIKNLSTDLIPTFELLLPLLTIHKKQYIVKFVSQALSFLIRKTSGDVLSNFVQTVFDRINELKDSEKSSYHLSLTTAFSEAFKNSSNTLHSKTASIMRVVALHTMTTPASSSVLCDIIIQTLNHADSSKDAKVLYDTMFDAMDQQFDNSDKLDLDQLTSMTTVITTLLFADSSRKISNWLKIYELIKIVGDKAHEIVNNIQEDEEEDEEESSSSVQLLNFGDSYSQMCAILFRNGDQSDLSRHYIDILDSFTKIDGGSFFLQFIDNATDFTREKIVPLAKTHVTSYISQNWKAEYLKISLFLTKMNNKGLINTTENNSSTFQIVIPLEFSEFITSKFSQTNKKITSDQLLQYYWRLLILKYTSISIDNAILLSFFEYLMASSISSEAFAIDISGNLIGALSNQQNLSDENALKVLELSFDKLENGGGLTSYTYMENLYSFVLFLVSKKEHFLQSKKFISSLKDSVSLKISDNLYSASQKMREKSLNLIIAINEFAESPVSDLIYQCRLIEQTELDLSFARDIQLRFRKLANDYSTDVTTSFTNIVVTRFIFGQLSNRFKPTWEGIFEILPQIINRIEDLVWNLAFQMISADYNKIETIEDSQIYYEQDSEILNTSDRSEWIPQDQRLIGNFEMCTKVFHSYQLVEESLVENSASLKERLSFSSFVRGQAIKLLGVVPHVAEKHFDDLLPYIINEDVDIQVDDNEHDDENEESESSTIQKSILEGWTIADRNALIEILTKFKKLNKVNRADELKEFLMTLLSNKFVKTQTLALNCLLNWKEPVYNRYKDNLQNLLDDTLFRDETIKLLQNREENQIQVKDVDTLLPIVVRILFGRAQTSRTSGTKQGRMMAAINILANLEDAHIKEFLKLSFHKIDYSDFIMTSTLSEKYEITERMLRTMSGFLNVNLEVIDKLGKTHSDCIALLIEPLIYTLSVSEQIISNESKYSETPIMVKVARNNRSMGFKLLLEITEDMEKDFNWSQYGDLIYKNLVKDKLPKFAQENLQQPSSLMKLMTTLWTEPNLQFFLFYDDYLPVRSLLNILPNPNAKDSVLLAVLDFIILLFQNSSSDDEDLLNVMTIVITESLNSLVLIFEHTSNRLANAKAVQVLLTLVEREFITDNENIKILIEALSLALEKSNNQVELSVKADIVKIIGALVKEYDCSLEEILPLYKNISKLYQFYPERDMRFAISQVFKSFQERFNELEVGCQFAQELNSYSTKRIRDPDFEVRLAAYGVINQTRYVDLKYLDWLPIVYTALFYINDVEELSLRSSSGYTLIRFIDCLSSKNSSEDEEVKQSVELLKNDILPTIRTSLRKPNEFVQSEYISVLGHLVEKSEEVYCPELSDMKVLLYFGDEEANFFKNVNHAQVHRRQRAIRRLTDFGGKISGFNISHYLFPIIEHYAFYNSDETLRNVGNETVTTISELMLSLSWNQFRGIYSRYISAMVTMKKKESTKPEELRDAIQLITSVTLSLKKFCEKEEKPKDFFNSSDKLDAYILNEVMPPMRKLLTLRDEDTVIARAPLSEALVASVMCCSEENINNELPGILTSICHILRSKSEELRDMIRKQLSKITVMLGSDYFRFIVKELKGSLGRGSQVHILSFTVHHLLVVLNETEEGGLKHGELSDCYELIMEIIMNDIFGTASQEKEADGYNNKMKEIKHNKSFDTGEILAKNIELKDFGVLITPIRYILQEKLSAKNQTKLDELLRRFSLGLNNNEESSSTDILILSHEIYDQSKELLGDKSRKKKELTEQEERFMVQLDVKSMVATHVEYGLYIKTLQKFSFELLRAAITKHESLYSVENLGPFVKILQQALEDNEDEGVMISSLRVLTLLVRLRFPDEIDDRFVRIAKMVLHIIQDSPSSDNELSQSCFRFLANVIRHKEDLKLKSTALKYILKKIEPSLDEPTKQGVAFNLLKALLQKHVMLDELYDTMNKVSEIMVTSTSNEIRDVSRSSFYIFLMEYEQSNGLLEKQFKKLISNLSYPAQDGRKSVMELIHLIITKASKDLLNLLAGSFFVALCNVMTIDNSPSCREMASVVIGKLLGKMSKLNCDMSATVDKFIILWIKQNKNELLVRCGLNVFKLYAEFVGLNNSQMNEIAISRVTSSLAQLKKDESEVVDYGNDQEDDGSISWELIYSSLNVVNKIQEVDGSMIYNPKYKESIWNTSINGLLYPHSWIRLASTRIMSQFLSDNVTTVEYTPYELQTVAYRLFRQFGAPNIMENLSNLSSKCLVLIGQKWYKEGTKYIGTSKSQEEDDEEEDQENEGENGDGNRKTQRREKMEYAIDWAINRANFTLKNDSRPIKELVVTKKAMIQYLYIILNGMSVDDVIKYISGPKGLLVTLISLQELDHYEADTTTGTGTTKQAADSEEVTTLALLIDKLMKLISDKLGNSEYNSQFAQARREIQKRREKRKLARSQLSLTRPDVAARNKIKKHVRSREKRKHNKDENGLYRDKSKRRKV